MDDKHNGHHTDGLNGHAPLTAQSKNEALEPFREHQGGEYLTSNQGLRINDTDNSLKAGSRGPTLLEDFHLREKITHFDHERIPERVVHARGMGAHGVFQVYKPLAEYTMAGFLQDPSVQTPVFVRFSTVAGSRGSADTPRDARGFAVKFYTQEGVFDLVGNNIPVFFIQDAIKFPDLIHAVKPEPHNEIPQAASAHDNFWDFISLTPEAMHMIMWVMSDRALPRSARMMEGFGVNTFRFINAAGQAHFVKFHWKPLLGVHSLLWDESQKLAGKDADWLRRDLWEAIETGNGPEWEFGVQLIAQEDEFKFDFDVLDATKLWPEALVPVQRIGKLILNRNPDNYFAETEQIAFHPGHLVPGIDVSNDPLLQGRLFSYLDTQISRIGVNFAELPINRPLAPVHNNQQDGKMRQGIKASHVNYFPNSLADGCPMTAPADQGGYVHYPERVEGHKIRERSASFGDHFSQASLFWQSQSDPEKEHIVQALQFELSMVESKEIRTRIIGLLANIAPELAAHVAAAVGVPAPPTPAPAQPVAVNGVSSAPELSMMNTVKDTIKTRRVAIIATDGVNGGDVQAMKTALTAAGAQVKIVSQFLGTISAADGTPIEVDKTFRNSPSVTFDAVYIPGGAPSVATLQQIGEAVHFVNEAFMHCKAIAATGEGATLLAGTGLPMDPAAPSKLPPDLGIVLADSGSDPSPFAQAFIAAIGQHRFFNRVRKDLVPA